MQEKSQGNGFVERQAASPELLIDIIVPIYNNYRLVRRCIDSVLSSPQQLGYQLIAVDDGSSEPDLSQYLADLAANDKLILLRNAGNEGFVRTANRGMRTHPTRDVVLLNSDTEVTGDWLDRLHACAYRQANIGTITPFSNNATICSFPVFCSDNPLPEGSSLSDLDGVFAKVNEGQYLEIPTAVGFCMYIRRACANAVGLFDEQRFGRGYGEENDFCRRALKIGWRNVLCADVFVYHAGSASFRDEREELIRLSEPVLQSLHPDYFDEIRAFVRDDPVAPLRRSVEIELARRRSVSSANSNPGLSLPSLEVPTPLLCRSAVKTREKLADASRPVQLHVMHDLGGGVDRWCRDYCRSDSARTNLILKPFCRGHAAGEGLMLFADLDDSEPIELWTFAAPFEVTALAHPEYAAVVQSIVDRHAVDAILVSSLIGHSLDVLATGLPTVFIAHDYFPACPAINLYYGGVCSQCDDERLVDCLKNNPDFNPFLLFTAEERLSVRRALLDVLTGGNIVTVVPSRIVWSHLRNLFPALGTASWVAIPHGVDETLSPIVPSDLAASERLRVIVLGMLSVNKGVRLLEDSLGRITEFADVYLVGAKEVGELFREHSAVHVIAHYELKDLQSIVQGIRPHVGLLLSIWPETFSYTLTELMRMAVPPLATQLGGFAERIIDGETGYLVDPVADALVGRLKEIDADRASVARIRSNLTALPRRGLADMVADYHQLLPLLPRSSEASSSVAASSSGAVENLCIRQTVALVSLWKQVKSLDLQLTMSKEARASSPLPAHIADRQRRTAEHQRTVAEHQRAVAEHQRALAEIQFGQERQGLQSRVNELAATLRDRDGVIVARDKQIQQMAAHLDFVSKQLTDTLSSTSWQISSPVRVFGNVIRRVKLLASCLAPALREPSTLSAKADVLFRAWKSGGLSDLRLALLAMSADEKHQDAWQIYRQTFKSEVKPRMLQALSEMKEQPLISILVPTFNTHKTMLRQMLESVKGQIYPNWELCIADDCSTQSHVKRILRAFAKNEPRIKLHFGTANHGVSHATNRAIEMATGKFVVLLDHDDVLEEQALFRVAQALLAEDPDMVYSDEVMVSPNLDTVLQYAHRPAFSPEFLRSHPYIVHLVGFRTQLLRDIGGFDENLKISQDYDLILRVAERAQTVVHIPEILYQWRIHGKSAGKQKMHDVMATSRLILQRHLERKREVAVVEDGVGFNLFDARYPLVTGLRVAIIVPTKNHGELVRQCVESIRATVFETDYDIVVIDHESDDPATLEYLSAITPSVTVLRYTGPFNFSAINNWAVAQVAGKYSHYLFCNNDIEALTPGWLERMLELGQHSDVGIVGAQLLYPDRVTIQHAGVCVGAFGAAEHFAKFVPVSDIPKYLGFSEIMVSNHEVSAVTAACLLIRRDAFDAVSGFDEALAVGFGDVDLCLRVGQLGYRVVQCPHAELLHHESFTRGKTTGIDPHPEDSVFFQARWQWFLEAGDPYFNPALYQNSVAWQVRQPMRCSFDIRRRVFRCDDESGKQSFSFNTPETRGPISE